MLLVQLSFIDHDRGGVEVSWVNEKVPFIPAPWGRIQPWKGQPCVVPPEQFSK
jgi:hypothetical protein